MTRRQKSVFIGSFLALIYPVSVLQTGIELGHGRHPQFLNIFQRVPTRPNLRAYEKQLEDESIVAHAVRPWVQYSQFVLFGDLGEKALAGRSGWLFYKPDMRYLVEAAPVEDPFRAITDFSDQLNRRGIHLLIIPIPGKPALYGDMLTRRVNGDEWMSSHTRGLMARLRAAGVETIDLFQLFGKLRSRPEPYYLLRDTHWTGEGAELAADTVARRVIDLGWIRNGNMEYQLQPMRVPRPSDIALMTRAHLIEAQFAAELVSCTQVIDSTTGSRYRDDPASPVLVLGDSFLRIYQNDAPRSAGFIAHLARKLKQPVASIVNDGGASTLVRQELARRPQLLRGKKVVIWEFVERDIRFGIEGWKPVPLPPA